MKSLTAYVVEVRDEPGMMDRFIGQLKAARDVETNPSEIARLNEMIAFNEAAATEDQSFCHHCRRPYELMP